MKWFKIIFGCAIMAIITAGVILGLYFGLRNTESIDDEPIPMMKGAIVSNGAECAAIGKSIMEKGGSAVDTAIAVMLCEGVILPHSLGLGGGCFATIYTRKNKCVETLVARDTAPLAATEDMFVSSGDITAVPGEVLAYWEMHQKFGILNWTTIIEPTIWLCRNGHKVSRNLHSAMKRYEARIQNEPSMREILINPETGLVWEAGDVMKRPQLAVTLEILAEQGADAIYGGGDLGKLLAKDIGNLGGVITEEDLNLYRVIWGKPSPAKLKDDFRFYTSPLPSSGSLVTFILNLMDKMMTDNEPLLWHRMVEAFKHAHGQRTLIGDMEFELGIREVYENLTSTEFADEIRQLVKDNITFTNFSYYGANFSNEEDHGTASVSVLAPNGDAVTITSTINTFFGGKVRSVNTGIILNDSMDDFATPGLVNHYGVPSSPSNYIKPRKRPISSMCPSIILDRKGNVKLLVGAAGGTKIVTAIAEVIIRYLYLNQSIEDSVQSPRLHHQLAPMHVSYEHDFDEDILEYLLKVGHVLVAAPPDDGFAALTAIAVNNFEPIPVFDKRRSGSVAIVDLR